MAIPSYAVHTFVGPISPHHMVLCQNKTSKTGVYTFTCTTAAEVITHDILKRILNVIFDVTRKCKRSGPDD
eukprot:3125566-Amphidinium_carterae.1